MYPLCGGTLGIIAEITDPDVIQKILHHNPLSGQILDKPH